VLNLIVRRAGSEEWRRLGLTPPSVELLNCVAYTLTLGFRAPSLLPAAAAPAAIRVDRWLQPLAPLLALRALAVWMREG
jgi:hypothetical protein